MRVAKLQMRMAMLALLALSASSCQTAQKPVPLLPPRTAPALTAKAPEPQQQVQPATPEANPPSQPQSESKSAPEAETQSSSATPAPDPVSDLIANVEKQYQAGLDAYHAGQTDAAKQDFDHAFNALLGSQLDVHSDDRLEKEFNRIVEGVNHLDLGSLGMASDSEAQKSEPAPIDETNDVTLSADAKVKAKAQAEIKSTHSDLPLMMTDQVAGYISYFSNLGRGTLDHAFARSGRYHDMMVKILREEGVPQDLIYLAQAESGFHPLAVSRARARGISAFMGSRAPGYRFQRSPWVGCSPDPQ